MATLLSYALTSVNDVKETLGINGSGQDNLIIRKINQATQFIEAYCAWSEDHHIAETTYTDEYYDGTGMEMVILKAAPVSLLTSLQYRTAAFSDNHWSTVDADQYVIDDATGIIEFAYNTIEATKYYKVSYTAGYDPIPADIAEACATLAGYYVENAATGTAVKKKQEGSRSIEYFQANTAGSESLIDQLGLDDLLAKYKRYNIAHRK